MKRKPGQLTCTECGNHKMKHCFDGYSICNVCRSEIRRCQELKEKISKPKTIQKRIRNNNWSYTISKHDMVLNHILSNDGVSTYDIIETFFLYNNKVEKRKTQKILANIICKLRNDKLIKSIERGIWYPADFNLKGRKKIMKNKTATNELEEIFGKDGKTKVKNVSMEKPNELCLIKGNTKWKMKNARKFHSPQLRDDLKYLMRVGVNGTAVTGISYGFFKKHGFKIRAISAEPRHFKANKVRGESVYSLDAGKGLEEVQNETMDRLKQIDGKPASLRTGMWMGGTYNTGSKLIIINSAKDLKTLQNALIKESREKGMINWIQIGKLILEHIETGTLICNQLDKARKSGAGQNGYQLFCTHIVKNGRWLKCDNVKFQEDLVFMVDYTIYEGVCKKEEQTFSNSVCACSGMIPPNDIAKIK